jgi:hypothetical protein
MASRRFVIHPPYLVNRVRSQVVVGGEAAEDTILLKTLNQVMSELHRYLRYLRDSNDNLQELLVVGSIPVMKRVELDFGTPAVVEKVFTVIDTEIIPTSRIIMTHSGAAATGKQADEAEFDAIDCRCEPATGNFKVYATSLLGQITGPFKFDYVVQA